MSTYQITIRPLPSDVPEVVRLRHALKTLLRAHKLRAVDVREVTDDADRDNSSEVINKSELHGNTCALIDPMLPAMTRAPDRTRRQPPVGSVSPNRDNRTGSEQDKRSDLAPMETPEVTSNARALQTDGIAGKRRQSTNTAGDAIDATIATGEQGATCARRPVPAFQGTSQEGIEIGWHR